MLVDSHVNLHAEQFKEDAAEIISRAHEAGVKAMLTISDRLENIDAVMAFSESNSAIWHSVGVHPHYAKDAQDLTTKTLVEFAQHSRCVGIGECGLDYYYEYSDRVAQRKIFLSHVEASQQTGLPLIIHTRDADEDMSEILRTTHAQNSFTPLMHCYTSGMELAQLALTLGGYVSFSGILSFKNAHDVRAIAEMVPLDRLLIETDCPYLAPVPMRGRRCEPGFLPYVAQALAEVKNISSEEIAKITTENFFRLFAKADRDEVNE